GWRNSGKADLAIPNYRVTYIKASHPARRNIKFNNTANIQGWVEFLCKIISRWNLYTRKFKDTSEPHKSRSSFAEHTPALKPLSNLSAKLSLKHVASLWKGEFLARVVVSRCFERNTLS